MSSESSSSARPVRLVYLLPNLATSGGLMAGFYAIIMAGQGQFEKACIAVFVAALLDGLDGRIARLTNTQSEFGVQYDSLADLVSFGMAPALVMYYWALQHLGTTGTVTGRLGWLAAFAYAVCAALRLARFNSQVGVVDKRWFIGLASPASAAVMMGLVWTLNDHAQEGRDFRWLAFAVTLGTAMLMVSNVRYSSFKGRQRVSFIVLPVAVLVLIALALYPPQTLLLASALYALSGPLLAPFRRHSSPTPETAP